MYKKPLDHLNDKNLDYEEIKKRQFTEKENKKKNENISINIINGISKNEKSEIKEIKGNSYK